MLLVCLDWLPKRTVLEALTGQVWISDIQGALTVIVISECILLWDLLSEVALQPGAEDSNFHISRLMVSTPLN